MRALGAFALAAALVGAASAGAGVVSKVRDNGPDENRVVLVLLAEGYTSGQQAAFEEDAEAALQGLFATPPYDRYARHFNVYTDFVASNESGADKPAACYATEVLRDTAFDATYCSRGIQRLVTVSSSLVFAEANAAVPSWDVVGVIVNDPEYGGAGGPYLTFSVHAQAVELFLHEAGHTFARLADEYEGDPGVGTSAPEPNVTTTAERGSVKWEPWVEADTPLPTPESPPWTGDVTGAFEGARYFAQGIYRPWHSCRMRDLGRPFGPVCIEAHVQNVYRFVSPVDGRSPEDVSVEIDPCAPFVAEITPLQPDPPTVSVRWTLDGVDLAETGFRLTLDPRDLPGPWHELAAVVADGTELVRRPYLSPMSDTLSWTLIRAVPPVDTDGDGVDDACDPDDDGDGVPDDEDCAPTEPDPPAPPPEVTGLTVAWDAQRRVVLRWTDAVGGSGRPDARHEVLTGRLAELTADRAVAGACRLAETTEAELVDQRPGTAPATWYLVRARDACGTGTVGTGSPEASPRDAAVMAPPDC